MCARTLLGHRCTTDARVCITRRSHCGIGVVLLWLWLQRSLRTPIICHKCRESGHKAAQCPNVPASPRRAPLPKSSRPAWLHPIRSWQLLIDHSFAYLWQHGTCTVGHFPYGVHYVCFALRALRSAKPRIGNRSRRSRATRHAPETAVVEESYATMRNTQILIALFSPPQAAMRSIGIRARLCAAPIAAHSAIAQRRRFTRAPSTGLAWPGTLAQR
jgi:hypothetical protein